MIVTVTAVESGRRMLHTFETERDPVIVDGVLYIVDSAGETHLFAPGGWVHAKVADR